MKKCLITASSMTYAMKAKQTLEANGIKCAVRKVPVEYSDGCGWGTEVDCTLSERATRILNVSDIEWKKVIKRE